MGKKSIHRFSTGCKGFDREFDGLLGFVYNASKNALEETHLSTDWLTVEEIAEELRVHVSTVREWIRQKRLKAAKFGRDYRIKRSDYLEFIDKHYNKDE